MMYAKGRGVPQDDKQAYAWLNVAGAQGLEEASKERDIVASKIDATTLSEAQALARTYFEKYTDEHP